MNHVIRRSELAHPTLSDGLLARYCPSITGPTSSTLWDLSGKNLHGILQGGLAPYDAWELNQGKYALRFRGRYSNENVLLPANLLNIPTFSPLTYSVWFYNTGSFTSYSCLQDGQYTRQVSIFLGPDADHLYLAVRGAAGSSTSTPKTMSLNRWHHLLFTCREDGLVSPWLDGEPCGTLGSGGGGWSQEAIHVGTNNSGGGDNFFGYQDDIAVYGRSVSPQEIQILSSRRGAAYEPRSRICAATVAGVVSKSETSTLALTSDAIYDLISSNTNRLADSTLALSSDASYFLLSDVYQVSQSLGLTDSVVVKGYEYDTDVLTLTQTANFRIGIPTSGYFIADSLNLTDAISRGQNYGVTDTLTFVDSADNVTPTSSTLALTQSVVIGKGRTVADFLQFTQTTNSESLYRRGVSHTNFLQQAVGYFVLGTRKCGKSTYSRFEGAGAEEGIPTQSMSGNHLPVSFESLTDSPATVFLRSPEMDDKHRMSFDRVNRETVGGELNVFRDDSWTTTKSMLFTIVGIKSTIFESMQSFLFATLGQEVLFNDWTGMIWRGVVTNPEEAATEDRDGYWTVAFEFEGSPYDGPPANHNIAFSQAASFTIE